MPGRSAHTLRIAMAVSRASQVGPTWTTLHLARAALERGHPVAFVDPNDFSVEPNALCRARAHMLDPPGGSAADLSARLASRSARRATLALSEIDVLLLRAGRLDSRHLSFAQLAASRGVTVINDPAGALMVSHKAWLAAQPEVPRPPTLVSCHEGPVALFAAEFPEVIIKPARGRGGHGTYRINPHNEGALPMAFRAAARRGDGYVVVQAIAPGADRGEHRLMWFDGEVLGAYLRRAAPGEFRHNLARGGTATAAPVSDAQREAARALSPALLAAGVRLAGLDLIGELVIEVNALNPGGLFHADRLNGSRLAHDIVRRLEQAHFSPRARRDTNAAPPSPEAPRGSP